MFGHLQGYEDICKRDPMRVIENVLMEMKDALQQPHTASGV